MTEKVARIEPDAGGWNVWLERVNAYTDGASSFRPVHLSYAAVEDKDDEAVLQTLYNNSKLRPERLIGWEVQQPASSKGTLWAAFLAAYDGWNAAAKVVAEGVTRGEAWASTQTATDAIDAAWTTVRDAAIAWASK